jgi:hypothetical protein
MGMLMTLAIAREALCTFGLALVFWEGLDVLRMVCPTLCRSLGNLSTGFRSEHKALLSLGFEWHG